MRRRTHLAKVVCLALVGLMSSEVASALQSQTRDSTTVQAKERPRVGGPDSVEVQLEEDARAKIPVFQTKVLEPYFDWKERLEDAGGPSFSVDYSTAFLGATESLDRDQSGGGMVRFFGSWDLAGGESHTGTFVWKVEHRHGYTEVAPGDFGFNLGYVGLIEPPFSDQGFRVTNLYWRHRFKQGRFTLLGGFLDATDYVDVYALASPWTHFMNLAFSTGSASIGLPGDAALGFAAAGMLTENLYVIGGLADSNSDPTDPFQGFDTFFNNREYFKHIEVGWTTSHDRIFFDNVHLTFWQVDERREAETPSGWGTNFSFTHFVKDRWMPFLRAGYAEKGGSLLQKSVSTGLGYRRVLGRDLLGFGFNWGQPNQSTFEPGLDDQYGVELFYRLQLSDEIAITPDIQYIRNPALNPEQDSTWVFGFRTRFAF